MNQVEMLEGVLLVSDRIAAEHRIAVARAQFRKTTPGMGSERTVALGKWNLSLIVMQRVKGYPKEERMVRGRKMMVNVPTGPLENRTMEIMEGVMVDGQSMFYYNGRFHEREVAR